MTVTSPPPTPRPPSRRRRLRRDALLLALMLPGVAYFLVFHYGALFGNVIAFQDFVPYLGVGDSDWVGFSNFAAMFGDPAFWNAVLNTVLIAALQLVFYFPVPLALALLLHSLTGKFLQKFVQSVVYLPHFISWVIVIALFQQILGGTGVLNGFLGDHGLHTVDIIGNPTLYKPLVVAQVIWKESGFGTIIFLAALSQVDVQQYEAAALDGAGYGRRLWHVTLPAIRPVIVLLLILRLGEFLSIGFEQFFLQRDAVGPEAGEVIDTFVYYAGFANGNWGLAAAAGLFKGVVGLGLIYTANRIAHRLGEQGVYAR
ncbi:polysaccharide ABC transporter ATP-binding protein [Longispora fulva]|uniref:Putative aldouronate transport system permease protein n=1 Tax=Longispora fulva TaxID=619741 RepID=A0A8J7GNE2_9ACTN|nr:ABC transporter permease subunit [Longispora fulva]MBG6134953.1 putative aldouronate transport system permease protein [Longispora fulva]GIG56815.1 polysaccharide ABC transporter ATP-binding protein [Longispora fulva]